MRGRKFASGAVAALIAASLSIGLAAPTVAVNAQPNIVVFYLDDVSPHDGSLWADPERTPNIYEQFVAHGVRFPRAVGETPQCCPGRANTLTGTHSQSTGVIENDARLFDPSMHVGKQLKGAGYASIFIGKYLNENDELTNAAWQEHQAGWTVLDGIYGKPTFENYVVRTKDGDVPYPDTHSTQMIADRAVMRFRETRSDQPIFAMLSFYDLHGPNHPQAEFVGDPRCADMPPWNTPAYNEADVSDNPPAIRTMPLWPHTDGWPMVTYCEEMLGADRAIGQVIDELTREGRLDNTVLVFTADNGIAWGLHRIGQKKLWPYTTPLPLYVRWPGHWGDQPSAIQEVVSNIDLAPTFCALGGCSLGPFAHGKQSADGLSLVGLLNGSTESLARDAVLESHYGGQNDTWSALRTTRVFDRDHLWHYVEYADGFRELYELLDDPWELDNLAGVPNLSHLMKKLHDRLSEMRVEGIAAGKGSIRIAQDSRPNAATDYDYKGDLGTFTLDDDTDPAHENSALFTDVDSGVYTIQRTTGTALAQINCTGVAQPDVQTRTLSVFVRPGDDVVCTWIDGKVRADATIALAVGEGPFKGNNVYEATPTKKQTVKRLGVLVGETYEYRLKVQNDGLTTDSFALTTAESGPSTVTAAYVTGGVVVTSEVANGAFEFESVAPGATLKMTVWITVEAGTPAGSSYAQTLRIRSAANPARVDSVRLVATLEPELPPPPPP